MLVIFKVTITGNFRIKIKSHFAAQSKTLSIKRLKQTFTYAFSGLKSAWASEANFRIEASIALLVLLLALWLQVELVPLLLCFALVLSLELINSALESLVDLASPSFHPLAKRVKDIAAAAVLLAAIITVVVGVLSLGPALWDKLQYLFFGS